MNYALKTADNADLFLDHNGQPVFVKDPAKPAEFWPVDSSVPAGSRQTGWALLGGICTATTEVIPPVPPPVMPWAISNADLRRGLITVGVNPALITGYLNSLAEGASKWVALADWEYANYFERSHPMLNSLAPAFGLTIAQVDGIFWSYPPYPRPFV